MKYHLTKLSHKNTFTIIFLTFLILSLGCSVGGNLLQNNARVTFDISPDGRQIVFSTNGGDLFLLNLETKKVEQITDTAETESEPTFSPDGEHILFNVSNSADISASYISRIDLATKKIDQLTGEVNASHQTPVYSQDGKRIAFLCSNRKQQRFFYAVWIDWAICVMDSNGKNVKVVSDKKGGFHSPRFIKDDTLILFTSSWFREDVNKEQENGEPEVNNNTKSEELDNYEDKLYTVASDGSSPITEFVAYPKSNGNDFPDFSDLDNIIVYNYIFIDLESRTTSKFPNKIENAEGFIQNFQLNRKTKELLFLFDIGDVSNMGSDLELWTMNLNGKNAKKIADKTLFSDPLSWSPK